MSDQQDNETARREAARMMGRSRSEAKVGAARENVKKATAARTGARLSEEHRAKLRVAAARRWGKTTDTSTMEEVQDKPRD